MIVIEQYLQRDHRKTVAVQWGWNLQDNLQTGQASSTDFACRVPSGADTVLMTGRG